MEKIADIIGIIGVILILLSYSLLQLGKLNVNSLSYSMVNLLGALLILISLFYNWNLASVIIEIFWILISLYGIGKSIWSKKIES